MSFVQWTKPINVSTGNMSKIRIAVTVGAGLGFALIYVITRILRKNRSPSEDLDESDFTASSSKSSSGGRKQANGSLPSLGKQDSFVGATVLSGKPSNLSRKSQRRPSHSLCSTASNSNLAVAEQPNHVSFRNLYIQEAPILLARECFSDAIKQWEKALTTYDNEIASENDKKFDKEKIDKLVKILDKAYQLQDEVNELLKNISPEMLDYAQGSGGERYLTYEEVVPRNVKRTLSVLSNDSFVSAVEDLVPPLLDLDVTITRPRETDTEDLILYQEGLKEVDALNVLCRVLRTEFLKCRSDDDFLAKLYGIRLAFDKIVQDTFKREWLTSTGRLLISDLLRKANKDYTNFYQTYDKLIDFSSKPENWPKIEDELRGRKLVEFSFYDVVLDFIFMDAFDDLANPPASVIAVAQNRFLSARLVESTLSAVVWSVLKAKRARLKYPDGFIAHFYDISEYVSPTMAWGFLGTDQKLKDLCNYFKSQICNFLIDLFSFERVRFTCVEDLAEDIWTICQMRAQMTKEMLEKENDSLST